MAADEFANIAKGAGLQSTHAAYPELIQAAIERGLNTTPALDAARAATTEPAHYFVVQTDVQ